MGGVADPSSSSTLVGFSVGFLVLATVFIEETLSKEDKDLVDKVDDVERKEFGFEIPPFLDFFLVIDGCGWSCCSFC